MRAQADTGLNCHWNQTPAERCVGALDQVFTGTRSFDEAMADYQRGRDEHVLPMYEFTCQLATLEPPPSDTKG